MRGLLSYKQPTTEVERTTLRIKADASGNVYIPIGGIGSDGVVGVPYKWKVSIDGGNESNYSGTGSSGGVIRVGYGLKPGTIHTVTIKPQVEEYGWCKALSYLNVNSTYKASLINILSDKSYMGYAHSETETGNYFKYYQYNGCTNLLDTDDESIPDSVTLIGDYYRAYEYAGCSSLKNNAGEKVYKNVRRIGNYYRAYQYQSCTSLSTAKIRAINWSTTGNNYRYNMFSSAGNNLNLKIEGGIVEGGSWGLTDSRVSSIKVYTGLVTDYISKLSGITSTKITNNPEWDTNNYEYIEFKIKADSNGDIKIPVAGYSTTGTQDCAYDWMVSVDNAETVEYTGTGSATAITVGTGTAGSEHRIIIYPKTESWGWGRAFGFYNSGIATLLTEFIHDSYKCYASSYTSTGNYFKYSAFYGCTLLTSTYEKLPTSVSSIGTYYLGNCYRGCTALTEATWEVIPYAVSIGSYYRTYQYYGCSNLSLYKGFSGYYSVIYPTGYRENSLKSTASNLKVYITRYEQLSETQNSGTIFDNSRVSNLYCYINDIYTYAHIEYWSDITSTKFRVWYYNYIVNPFYNINRYSTDGGTGAFSGLSSGYHITSFDGAGLNGTKFICSGWSDRSSYEYKNIYVYPISNYNISGEHNYYNQLIQWGTGTWDADIKSFYMKGNMMFMLYKTASEYSLLRKYVYNGTNYVESQSVALKGSVYTSTGSMYIDGGGFGFANNGQFFTYYAQDVYSSYSSQRIWRRWIYRLSTPFDITSAADITYHEGLFPSLELFFSDDGYKLYTSDGKQYTLAQPFDITTASDTGLRFTQGTITSFAGSGDRLYVDNKQYIYS